MMTSKTQTQQTPAAHVRVPGEMVAAAEAIAERRRKTITGCTDLWSAVAREAMTIGLAKLRRTDE